MLKRIDARDVKMGMFIAQFGGSWFEHPFWRAKFVVETKAQRDRITQASVSYVVIDESRGLAFAQENKGHEARDNRTPKTRNPAACKHAANPKRKGARQSANAARALSARQQAIATLSRSKAAVSKTFEDLQVGWAVDLAPLGPVVDDIRAEIERDAKALFSVTRLKKKDDYTYLHSVAVCALMVALAQQMGYENDQARELGIAGLLHDVGKIGTPDDILQKPGELSETERKVIRNHPEHGHTMLSEMRGISPVALDVCLHHHEKVDGTGYPFGLAGEEISVFTRMAAVCDVFDALTSYRSYKKSMSDEMALEKMWSWEGHFDRHILGQLMIAIHAIPAGFLVRLSDDTLAVIQPRKTYDTVIRAKAVYSAKDRCRIEDTTVSIASAGEDLRIVAVEDPLEWGFSSVDEMVSSAPLAA